LELETLTYYRVFVREQAPFLGNRDFQAIDVKCKIGRRNTDIEKEERSPVHIFGIPYATRAFPD
jgi:hypothetical protein